MPVTLCNQPNHKFSLLGITNSWWQSMKIILMASWALPDLIFLTCTLLKDLKVTCASFLKIMGWKIMHDWSLQAWLVMANTLCFLLQEVYKWLYSTPGDFPLQLTLSVHNIFLQAKTGWWYINCRNEFLLGTGKMSGLFCTAIIWTSGRNEADISRIIWILIYNTKMSHANDNPENKPLC